MTRIYIPVCIHRTNITPSVGWRLHHTKHPFLLQSYIFESSSMHVLAYLIIPKQQRKILFSFCRYLMRVIIFYIYIYIIVILNISISQKLLNIHFHFILIVLNHLLYIFLHISLYSLYLAHISLWSDVTYLQNFIKRNFIHFHFNFISLNRFLRISSSYLNNKEKFYSHTFVVM